MAFVPCTGSLTPTLPKLGPDRFPHSTPPEGGSCSRELGLVLGLSLVGLVLVMVVAFAPWYGPVVLALGH